MQDKKTLIVIIILLAICLPITGLGIYKHIIDLPDEDELLESANPNHDFIYDNVVYFYSNTDELITTYECSNCSTATTVIDDTDYHTNSYLTGTDEIEPVINSYFGIFMQGSNYILYNLMGNSVAGTYQAIKTYRVEQTNPVLLVKESSLWGVVYLNLTNTSITAKYEYIAIPSHFINGALDTSAFIAKKNLLWYIIDNDGNSLHSAVRTEVTDFNDNYYVGYNNGYKIYDYDGNEYLTNLSITNAYGVGEYMFVVSSGLLLVYTDLNNGPIYNITLPEYESLYFSQNDVGIDIIIDENLYDTIVL